MVDTNLTNEIDDNCTPNASQLSATILSVELTEFNYSKSNFGFIAKYRFRYINNLAVTLTTDLNSLAKVGRIDNTVLLHYY